MMERAQNLKCSHCRLILGQWFRGRNLKKAHDEKMLLDTH